MYPSKANTERLPQIVCSFISQLAEAMDSSRSFVNTYGCRCSRNTHTHTQSYEYTHANFCLLDKNKETTTSHDKDDIWILTPTFGLSSSMVNYTQMVS
jgi:extradiol dioxygenase family protein